MSQLADKARLAVLWTAGFDFFRDLFQFGLMLVLVRILPAEAYGQFGLTTTLLSFLTLYSFRSLLDHALLARREEDVRFQAHFSAGAVVQVGVFALANVIALVLRWMPSYAPISPLLHVMSVMFLLDLPSELRVKMLERALDWKRRRLLHGVAVVAAGAVSVALALSDWGVYALLLPLFVVPIPFIWDLFIVARWRPTWEWSWAAYRPTLNFGATRMLAASFVNGAQLLESAWLTAAVGFATLGIFGRAIGLSQLTCQRVATVVSTSVYPVLTKISPRTDAYRKAGALLLRSVAWSVVPGAVLVGLLSTEIVAVLYGGRWSAVAPLLPWAAGAGAVAAVLQPAYMLLLAHERQDKCLVADMWRLTGTVAVLLVCLPFGLSAYLAGLALVHAVSLGLVIHWLERDGAVSFDGVSTALIPPVVAAAISAASVGASLLLLPDFASSMRTLSSCVLFCAAYVVSLRVLYGAALAELVGYLPERRRLSRLLLLPGAA